MSGITLCYDKSWHHPRHVTYYDKSCKLSQIASPILQKDTMDMTSTYAQTLRGEAKRFSHIEEGVPFFVPKLGDVKTSKTCLHAYPKLVLLHEAQHSGTSYRKQGDPSMYNRSNVLLRQRLRKDIGIISMLEKFWKTLNCIRKGRSGLSEKEYRKVFLKMFKALSHPQEFCIIEGRRIVKQDWIRDCEDNTMSKRVFMASLFEVADIWTTSTDPVEYRAFLTSLFDRITMIVCMIRTKPDISENSPIWIQFNPLLMLKRVLIVYRLSETIPS